MMKRLLLSSVFLLATCSPVLEDRRSDNSRLVLMALNAEFLWDGIAPEEGKAEFPWKGSQQAAEAHMADIAALVAAHDPDILHLAEVENQHALATFNDKFLSGHGYRPYLSPGSTAQPAKTSRY